MRDKPKQLVSMPVLDTWNTAEIVACRMAVHDDNYQLQIDVLPPPSFHMESDGAIVDESVGRDPDVFLIPEGPPGMIWGIAADQKIKEIETECAEIGIPFRR